jgi:hypothetical protein
VYTTINNTTSDKSAATALVGDRQPAALSKITATASKINMLRINI